MIREAKEILQDEIEKGNHYSIDPFTIYENMQSLAIQAIKVAQREAIEECLRVVDMKFSDSEFEGPQMEIDEQSILNLLNEVK